MKNFVMQSIVDWENVGLGEIYTFDRKFRGSRKVKLSVTTNAFVEVWAGRLDAKGKTAKETEVLVAASDGQFHLSFATEGEGYWYIAGPKDAAVFVHQHAQDMSTKRRGDLLPYTNVEPRQRRNSDLDRMMHLMRLNEKARDQRMNEALSEMRKGFGMDQVVEPEPTPEPTLEPSPEPTPEPTNGS